VGAVCVLGAARAERAARRLRCAAAGGPTDLLERADVDAVLLLGGQWYGLWPLEQACRAGKPVYCAASLSEDVYAETLCRLSESGQVPVLLAPLPGLTVLLERLQLPAQEATGRAVLVRIGWTGQAGTEPLDAEDVLPLLQACAALLGGTPVGVRASGAGGFVSVVVEFAAGRVAQLTLWSGPAPRSSCRLEVVAETGTLAVELPRCSGEQHQAGGRQTLQLVPGEAERELLRRFAQGGYGGLAEACAALTWLRAARQSLAEDRRVALGS
jgi:predicted dehydrogenase